MASMTWRSLGVVALLAVSGCLQPVTDDAPPADAEPEATPCGSHVEGTFYDCTGTHRLVAPPDSFDPDATWTCLSTIYVPVSNLSGRDGSFRADLWTDMLGVYGVQLQWWTPDDAESYHARVGFWAGGHAEHVDIWYPSNDGGLHGWVEFVHEDPAAEGKWGVMATEVSAFRNDTPLPGFQAAVHDEGDVIRYIYHADGAAFADTARWGWHLNDDGSVTEADGGINQRYETADGITVSKTYNGAYAESFQNLPHGVTRKPVCTLFGGPMPPPVG